MNKNHAVALLISFAVGVATWTVARATIENKRLNEGLLDTAKPKNSISDDEKRYAQGDYYVDLTDEEPSETVNVVEIKVSDFRTPEDITTEIPQVVITDTTFPTPDDLTDDDDFEPLGADDEEVQDVEQEVEENHTVAPVIIGDEDGHISRTSKEYENLILDALTMTAKDEDYTLVLYGKLNGLGARGNKTGEFVTDINGVKYEGKSYDAVAINKLYTVMNNKKS